jgi:hypothetical protein
MRIPYRHEIKLTKSFSTVWVGTISLSVGRFDPLGDTPGRELGNDRDHAGMTNSLPKEE